MFNKLLACLNDQFVKKGVDSTVSKYTQKNQGSIFFNTQHHSETEEMAISIFNNVLNDVVTDRTFQNASMACNIVDKIVNSPFESAQKPTAHSGIRENTTAIRFGVHLINVMHILYFVLLFFSQKFQKRANM